MEAASQAGARELGGEKAQRIIAAMRASVAKHGVAGSTFDRVAREAGVSRGLLHYYFGTKERLLVEVVRQDAEFRIDAVRGTIREAKSVEDVLDILVRSFEDVVENDPGFFLLLFELFTAGRRNPEIRASLGELYDTSRDHVAATLQELEAAGVLKLRFAPHPTVAYLFSIADGYALQRLSSNGGRELFRETMDTAVAAGRFLLSAE